MDFDVALAELGIESLGLDLLLGELDLALAGRLLQPKQSLVAGLEAVAHPNAPHPARTDLEPAEHQLVGHSLGPVGGMLERMGQDRLLDRGRRDERCPPIRVTRKPSWPSRSETAAGNA